MSTTTATHYAGRFGTHYCETHKGDAAGSVKGPRKMSAAAVAKALYGWDGTVREGVLCDTCAAPLVAHLLPKTTLEPTVVNVYVATLYGGSKSYACAEHRTGNHVPAPVEQQGLDVAAVCWFDSAHGNPVSDAEADAMLLGVR